MWRNSAEIVELNVGDVFTLDGAPNAQQLGASRAEIMSGMRTLPRPWQRFSLWWCQWALAIEHIWFDLSTKAIGDQQ